MPSGHVNHLWFSLDPNRVAIWLTVFKNPRKEFLPKRVALLRSKVALFGKPVQLPLVFPTLASELVQSLLLLDATASR